MSRRGEVDGDEGEPNDAGGVHGESNVLGLIERFWDLPRENGVDGAYDDERQWTCKCNCVRGVDVGVTDKHTVCG